MVMMKVMMGGMNAIQLRYTMYDIYYTNNLSRLYYITYTKTFLFGFKTRKVSTTWAWSVSVMNLQDQQARQLSLLWGRQEVSVAPDSRMGDGVDHPVQLVPGHAHKGKYRGAHLASLQQASGSSGRCLNQDYIETENIQSLSKSFQLGLYLLFMFYNLLFG